MEFKSISILNCGIDHAWNAMLKHLPSIGENVDDLECIIEKDKSIINSNKIKIVNEWHAKPNLPAIISNQIKPEMLIWTDTAIWNEKEKVVEWQIVSLYFLDQMQCSGSTLFEPAMGGKGTRITFKGELQWLSGSVSLGFGVLDKAILKVVESVLVQLIPTNFRKIVNQLPQYSNG